MKKWERAIRSKMARVISLVMTVVMTAVMVLGGMPSIPARAEDGTYPYMLFAASDEEGAVTLNANNTGFNGNVATNGTIAVIGGNCNINGTRTERAGENGEPLFMPDLRERIINTYFTAGTEEHAEDYALEETNINVNTPIEGGGEVSLTGNINLNAGIMAQEDIIFDGEVKNSGDVVLYSASGNVVINSTNVNLNGFVYAPYGEIRITSMNVNMNSAILIAQKITIEAGSINGGMNQGIARFIGTEYNVIVDGAGNDYSENPEIDWSVDTDGDGIPNREEIDKGLNPASADSDYDGISDYDEIYVYGTDPVNADSDGDGIKDGDEISLGLDPLNGSTNGVPDGEYMIHQTVEADSEALAGINTAANPYRLSIELDASGYVEGNIIARESPYAVSVGNDAALGMVAGLEYQDGIAENVTLRFEIAEPYRENVSGLYVQYSEANQGIRRFTVFCLVDEVNMMIPVRTQYDLENNCVYAEVNGFGTYYLIDRELWYEQLGIMPDDMEILYGNNIQTYAATMDSEGEAAAADTGRVAYALINGEEKKVYLYGGHMYAVYAGPATWTEAKEYCENLGGHLAVITSKEEQNFMEEYVLTADIAPRYWIGGYSETYPFDFQWVTGEEFYYTNWDLREPNFSNELYIEIYGNYNGWYGYWNNHPNECVTKSFICEWEEGSVPGNDIRVYNAMTWTALPGDFGPVSINSTQDYDGDSLLDVDEIIFEHVLYGEPDENGVFELPTFGEILGFTEEQCGIELPEEWGLGYNLLKKLLDTKMVLVCSDPTRIDTDGDLFMDGYSVATAQDGYYPYADPNPMKSDVTITSLANDYISIDYECLGNAQDWSEERNDKNDASYGGNQDWFDIYGTTGNDMIFCNGTCSGNDVQKHGCGLIAAADTLLYMMIGEIDEDTTVTFEKPGITVDIKDSYQNIDYETYIDYVTGISDYCIINDPFGVPGFRVPVISEEGSLLNGIVDAGHVLGYSYSTLWPAWSTDADDNLVIIRGRLLEDIPVIISYIDIWHMQESEDAEEITIYKLENMVYNVYEPTNGHYMTITGVIEYSDDVKDLVGHKTMLRISTWGLERYVDYDWYAEHFGTFNNMLCIVKN